MDLTACAMQWAIRPDDERFENIEAMLQATKHYKDASKEEEIALRSLQVMGDDTLREVVVTGPNSGRAMFSNYGFRKFSALIGAPASYLQTLPASLAGTLMQHGLLNGDTNKRVNLLMQSNGVRRIRTATSAKYERIWDAEVVEHLSKLQQATPDWQVPPARPAREGQKGTRRATEADCLRLRDRSNLSIKPGDLIAPAGLYASDHDMFAFLVNESRLIDGGGNGSEAMARGFYISNSEVGDRTFSLTMFLYSYICGNHIIWGAKHVQQVKIRHVGHRARNYFHEMMRAIRAYSDQSTQGEERQIAAARTYKLIEGSTVGMSTAKIQEKVCERVYRLNTGITKAQTENAWELGARFARIHGEPDTAWGFVGGLTRLSQQTSFADERERLDRAAGRVLDLVPMGSGEWTVRV